MRILLIEDQLKVAENLKRFLETESFVVTVANDGSAGLQLALTEEFDLVILDINLPGTDGFSICEQARQAGRMFPILMPTARTKREEIVHGLNLGADDYLVKPFDLSEVLARVRSLLRRSNTTERQVVITINDIEVDTTHRTVTKKGKRVNVSPKEYALLEFLLRRRGFTQDRPTILEHVWGNRDDLMFSQTVDVHIAYLRRKLSKDLIETIPGHGYRIPLENE
jgi:DNA-binding response OmpR family regulator